LARRAFHGSRRGIYAHAIEPNSSPKEQGPEQQRSKPGASLLANDQQRQTQGGLGLRLPTLPACSPQAHPKRSCRARGQPSPLAPSSPAPGPH
jgi:hypothetical protein